MYFQPLLPFYVLPYLQDFTGILSARWQYPVFLKIKHPQHAFICSKLAIETLEKKKEICSKLTTETPEQHQ